MNSEDYFFLIFLAVLLAVRLFLYLRPTPGPTLDGFRVHHWMVGLLIVAISLILIIPKLNIPYKVPLTIFAIGFALFIDELTYILISGRTHADNYSKISLIGTTVFIAVVFLVRKYIVMIFGK